jgi:eukaryotic-like serine/threonine-protein kinase
MAMVFVAHSARAGAHRVVALKCIRPELARNPRFVDMFLDEAKIAARIHHPNVCSVLDFDEHHGTYYLAMELLSGHTLTSIQHELRTTRDADPRVGVFARILEAACEGLHAAHETQNETGEPLDVVHRDVSPDNLFVTYDGVIKVMDFGVAYASERYDRTRSGVLKGKCAYVAPEMIAGAKPDRRADIWGLGVVAWEMFTRRKLFDQGNEPAVLHAIAEHEIPLPSQVRPELPPLVDEVVMRALEREPSRRYATTRELGRMLNRLIVEQRLVVGAAEVADFVCALFPEGKACARQLVRFAEQLEAPPRARTHSAKESPTVADASVARALARKSVRTNAATTVAPPQATGRLLRRWLAVAAVVVVVLASATFVACQLRTAEPAASAGEPQYTDYSLEAVPAGVDASGAVLLRVRIVRKL